MDSSRFYYKEDYVLSEKNCDRTFKNVLRGKPEDNIYREHRQRPFNEKVSYHGKVKLTEKGNIFEDNYKMNSTEFDPQKANEIIKKKNLESRKSNEVQRYTGIKSKKDMIKTNPNLILPENTKIESSEYQTNHNPIRDRFIRDTFGKNPLVVISKDEQSNINETLKAKLNLRTEKISSYLGSNGVRTSVTSTTENESKVIDKITNVNIDRLKSSYNSEIKKNCVKAFKHGYENKRVFYA